MKIFTPDNSFDSKVNFVDENNRVVGFSMAYDCCEKFGYAVCRVIPATSEEAEMAGECVPDEATLAPYRFVEEQPSDCLTDGADVEGGGGLAFRIAADGQPDMYVVIWNHHNGWYSHGFEYWGGEGSL